MKTYNYLQILLFAFLIITTAGCSNDDTSDSLENVVISGTWNLQSFFAKTIIQPNVTNPSVISTVTLQSIMPEVAFSFETNPNQVISTGNLDIERTLVVTGSSPMEVTSIVEDISAEKILTGAWSENENSTINLTITSPIDATDVVQTDFTFVRKTGNLIEITYSSSQIVLFEGSEFQLEKENSLILTR